MSTIESGFAPFVASTGVPVSMAMQRLWLTGQLLPAGARLVVQHIFRSDEQRPLEVVYSFPLPRDAALRSFRISGEGFEAHSVLKETREAVKIYEQGILESALSSLLRPYSDGLVNLTVGNIRPRETVTVFLELLAGVELRDDGFRFRFPFTLAPSYHPMMRTAVTEGAGELELPAAEFGDLMLPPFRRDASALHAVGFDLSVLQAAPVEEIGSPSHNIKVRPAATGPVRVALGPEKDVPDRDLVLDVRFAGNQVRVVSGPAAEDGKRSFAIIVPSVLFGEKEAAPRRTVILLDRSGSMQGEPIVQARKAIEACLAALTEEDSFGLLAFDDHVETMHSKLVGASRKERDLASKFLKRIEARGGTELAQGVEEAARLLGGAGDIVVITDGQVFGTEKILARARATGIRLFCLGIGSASQDRFLSQLARETGGVSRFVTARERVDLAAVDLFASIGSPVATGLSARGVEPEPPNAVFAGTPVLLFGDRDADSRDAVELTWDGGGRLAFDVPSGGDASIGEAVRLLRGSRLITDAASSEPREEADPRLLSLSREYGLASRVMSLVAVVKRSDDRASDLPETRVVPVGMPQGTDFNAYFPRIRVDAVRAAGPTFPDDFSATFGPCLLEEPNVESRRYGRAFSSFRTQPDASRPRGLVDLAALLEPDGGMPGKTVEVRAARTIAAIFACVAEGHTPTSGAFRRHVGRLVRFLASLRAVPAELQPLYKEALDSAASGRAPAGDWLALALDAGTRGKDLLERRAG